MSLLGDLFIRLLIKRSDQRTSVISRFLADGLSFPSITTVGSARGTLSLIEATGTHLIGEVWVIMMECSENKVRHDAPYIYWGY